MPTALEELERLKSIQAVINTKSAAEIDAMRRQHVSSFTNTQRTSPSIGEVLPKGGDGALLADQMIEEAFQKKFTPEKQAELFGDQEPTFEEKILAINKALAKQNNIEPGHTDAPFKILGFDIFGQEDDFLKKQKLSKRQESILNAFDQLRGQEVASKLATQQAQAAQLSEAKGLVGEFQRDIPTSLIPFLNNNNLLTREPDIVEPRLGPPQAQHVGNTLEQAVSSVDPTLLQSLGVDEFFGQPSAPRPDLGLEPVVTPGGIDPNAPLSPQALRLGAARLKTDLATQRGLIAPGSSFEIERQKQINALRKSEADLANTASLIQEREQSGGAVQERLKLLESKVDFEREQKKAARNVQLLNVTKFLFEESGLEGPELVEKLSDAMDILIPDSPKVTVKERSFINNILKKLKGEQHDDIFLGERKAEEVVIEPRPLSEQELKAEEERQRRRF